VIEMWLRTGCLFVACALASCQRPTTDVKVYVNGVLLHQRALTVDGEPYLPLDEISKAFGASMTSSDNGKLIRIDGGIGEALQSRAGAWPEKRVRAWADNCEQWLSKTKELMSHAPLIETEKYKGIRANAKAFASNMKSQPGEDNAASLTYSLTGTMVVYDMVAQDSYTLLYQAALHTLRNPGAPSHDLSDQMLEQASKGLKLRNEAVPHMRALSMWYESVAGVPVWE